MSEQQGRAGPAPSAASRRSRTLFAGVLIATAAVSIVYRLLKTSGAYKTSALFVGLPLLVAFLLLRTETSKSVTAMLLKGSSLVMLLCLVALPEGFLCFLFIAPLTWGLVALVGAIVDMVRAKRGRDLHPMVFAPFALLLLEGVGGVTPFAHGTVTQHRHVEATVAEVRVAVASTPVFDKPLPLFLRVGFPRPVSAEGSGLNLGDRRLIRFDAAGDQRLVLEVTDMSDGHVRFTVTEHTTMIAEWVDLHWAEVRWKPAADGGSDVSWTLSYERLLSPAIYFGPLQRHGVAETAEYLLSTVADPRPG